MNSQNALWWRIVRFGFRLLYHELAWTYDVVSWTVSLGHWRSWQRAAIPHLNLVKGDQVLELAHGTADLQLDLFEAGYSSVGLDISAQMGRIAKRKLRGNQLSIRLVRGSGLELPFADQSFKAVVSTFPTEFIFAPKTLAEVYRILHDEGRFVIVPNGMVTGNNPVTRFIDWLFRITGQRGDGPADQIKDFFQNAGFHAELITETLPQSEAWVVIATKEPTTRS